MQHTLITGANTGIGLATAIALAKKQHTIIIACRNEAKAQKAVSEIKAASDSEAVHYLVCDLASLASVRNCAEEYRRQFGRLDILINNAGLITDKLQFTKEGFEMQMGVNHLGHFLLTTQLIELLEKAPQPRVVNVSSKAHFRGKINFKTFKGEIGAERYNGMVAYGQSKLANVIFTKELIRRHPKIVSHSLHPGVVGTEIAGKNGNKKLWRVMWNLITPFLIKPSKGALTSVYLATSTEALQSNGKFFDQLKEKEPAALANDVALANELWEVSEKLTSGV